MTDTVEQHQSSFKKALKDIGVDKIDANLNTFKDHNDSYISKAIFEQSLDKRFTREIEKKFSERLFHHFEKTDFNQIKGAKKLIDHLT